MDRAPGLSVRLKLTLSYAGFLMVAGVLLLAVVWVFLLRYVPDGDPHPRDVRHPTAPTSSAPSSPKAATALGFLLVFGLAGRMGPRRPDARAADSHHRRDPAGRERVAVPPDPAGGPQRRVPRARRRVRHHARAARSRTSPSSRGSRPTPPTSCAPRWRSRRRFSTWPARDPHRDTGELVERLHAVNARAIDLTEALLLLSRADQRSFTRSTSTCPSSRKKPPRRCSPSQRSAASPSRPPATSRPPSAHTRSCCR